MPWFSEEAAVITPAQVDALALRLLDEARTRSARRSNRVLLLPPDLTRAHSGAGRITETLYRALAPTCDVHVIPTLGQHRPHTEDENRWMFGSIPHERIHPHDWLGGVTPVGTDPGVARGGDDGRSGGLGDSGVPQHDADDREVGSHRQRRPRRAARGARLRQPQQELLHRARRQATRSAPAIWRRPSSASRTTSAAWSRRCAPASTGPKTRCSARCPMSTSRS